QLARGNRVVRERGLIKVVVVAATSRGAFALGTSGRAWLINWDSGGFARRWAKMCGIHRGDKAKIDARNAGRIATESRPQIGRRHVRRDSRTDRFVVSFE